MKLISGRSNKHLANLIAKKLNISLVDIVLDNFANSELRVEIKEKIRECNVYILQTSCQTNEFSVNDYLFELCSIVDTCKRSHAKSITVIVPCFPYARSDKKDKSRVPINAKLVINFLKTSGADRIVTIDIHSGQIQGFIDKPFHNLYSMKNQLKYIRNTLFKDLDIEQINAQYILVSPDAGGYRKIDACAEELKMSYVTMNKKRDYSQKNVVSKSILAGNIEEIKNKTAIIIDDIVDTFGTMIITSEILHSLGVKDVIILATHGIFSDKAIEKLNNCNIITKVVVTNTIDQSENIKKSNKIEILDMSGLLTKFIQKMEFGESVGELFNQSF